jgi:hypothetical protein
MIFHSVGNFIIPTNSYFSEGVGIPQTRGVHPKNVDFMQKNVGFYPQEW